MDTDIKDYSIDLGFIFKKLLSKWRVFDQKFINRYVHTAFFETYKRKGKTYTFNKSDEKFDYYRKRKINYRRGLINKSAGTKKTENLPFLDFNFTANNTDKISVFLYYDSCKIIDKNEEYFNLFFALQFYLTDKMEGYNFLSQHLEKTFSNDLKGYKDFLKLLYINYDFFLSKKHEQIIKSFFDDYLHDKTTENIIAVSEKNKPKIINEIISVEILNDFIKINETENNKFCKAMPIKLAIDHFIIFTQRNNKDGKPFLSEKQFISFIKRAFLNDKSIEKITLNFGSREKLFIVKRFYEFFELAANGYENTNQCKDKYIKLLTDNFTNWSYDTVKNNFGNKVKKQW